MRDVGYEGEDIAADYLISRGYKIIERNYTRRCGEIDLIAEEILSDKKVLAFVEVKYYKEHSLRDLHMSIDWRKQRKIIRTAERYLRETKQNDRYVRFDAVLITASLVGELPSRATLAGEGVPGASATGQKIELIKDAFRADR